MFILSCVILEKIPHSQAIPWVEIEQDIKIQLENCIDIGGDTLELEANFVNLEDTFKSLSEHKKENKEESFELEYEKLNINRYEQEPDIIPFMPLFDKQYVYNEEGKTNLKQLYKAYPTLTDEINLAHHDILEQFLMKDKRKVSMACAINKIEGDKSFLETQFGQTDEQQKENKDKMMITNLFYDITYVLGETKKENIEENPFEVMKNMYYITQISKKVLEFVGYISGQKNFCDYVQTNSNSQVHIEGFEDIGALEDMFDARLINYQRKIYKYLEKLKNEKGVFEDINYSGIFVAKKAENEAKDGQNSPLSSDGLENEKNFMQQQVEKLDGSNINETFQAFGSMEQSGLPAEDIGDAIEAIKIIQDDFPRYINQIEKDEIIKRKEQAYLKIIPLLKSIHAFGRILEVEDNNQDKLQKITKKEFKSLSKSKQKFLQLMHNLKQKTGQNQQKFLSGLVNDLVHLERISQQRKLAMERNKKQRKLQDLNCDPYFFRIHPLIIRNWTTSIIEIDNEFINQEKSEQTPENIYHSIKFSPLVFLESLNKIDFKPGFSENTFTKFLDHFSENYDMNQHKFYFVVKYFHDFFEGLIKEYVLKDLDFYSCYQKVKYFSYEDECPLQEIFEQIAVEVDFSKLAQLKTGNFLEDGEVLYQELEKFIHHLDQQVKTQYEELKLKQDEVDKEVDPIEKDSVEDEKVSKEDIQVLNKERKLHVQII